MPVKVIPSQQYVGILKRQLPFRIGTLNVDTFMERKRERLIHFVNIITPIAEIYDLPMGSLRIFYDITSGCIAFNRKGTLYLNLRYFEVWREYNSTRSVIKLTHFIKDYQDVKNGDLRRALSSWSLSISLLGAFCSDG